MEGVVDPVVRELWSAVGGIDYCVTEFIRVTSTLLPDRVFHRYCPELMNGSKTSSGTPVFVQLLGSDLISMGENAHKASELGAFAIDLNFGCPAKTVNRHDGGAALLKNPERVFQVVQSVRRAVPKDKWVTVKVRLGYSDKNYVKEIAQAAEAGGGHWLTVHARTKEEAYRPPAHWEYIALMKDNVNIPVIANGDIWTPQDHARCVEVSGCADTMLGRGLIASPDLAFQIKNKKGKRSFPNWENFIFDFFQKSREQKGPTFAVARIKQLSKLMARTYPESQLLFESIKKESCDQIIERKIQSFFCSKKIRPLELMIS